MTDTKSIQAGERTQHTPGPWRFDNPNTIVAPLVTSKEVRGKCSTLHIADVYETQFDLADPETLDANARLIAAAPDLLEALTTIAKQCGPYAEKQPALDYASIGNIARFAIAKAEGSAS